MKADQKYYDALQRLIDGTATTVDTASPRFKITRGAVTKEAGAAVGSIRPNRQPELVKAIEKAEAKRIAELPEDQLPLSPEAKARHQKELKEKANNRYQALKEENEEIKNTLMNAVREIYHLRRELREFKKKGGWAKDSELDKLIWKVPEYKDVH